MGTFEIIITAAAFALALGYAAYTLARKGRGLSSAALSGALASTALFLGFDLAASVYPAEFETWKRLSIVAESLAPGLWLLFSTTYARSSEARFTVLQKALLAAALVFPAAALSLPVESFFYSPDFEVDRVLFLGRTGYFFYIGVLVCLIAALINLEATLRTARGTARWKIKLEALGAGALIAVLVFHYSQGLLYRTINMHLLSVRSVALIIAVLMIGYSRARRGNGVRVYVSKDMAYRSTVILIFGLYLVGLGLTGEGMRYLGESAQRDLLAVLTFLGALVLAVVLLSEKVKRKLKVYIHKNFYTNKYDYRAQWLQFTERITSSKTKDEVLRSILSGFAETFGMKGATLFLLNGDGYKVASEFETYIPDAALPAENGIVRHMASKGWVLYAEDPLQELSAGERAFLKEKEITFAVPLFMGGAVGGFITLKGPLNRNEIWTYEDYDLMKTLSKQASSTIQNFRLSEELASAREMEALGRVSAFVAHDLKNLVSTLSLMAENAAEHMDNPEFQKDMVESLGVTVEKMKGLISRLRTIKEKETLNMREADLKKVALDAVKAISGEVTVEGAGAFAMVDTEEMQKVVLNLVINAIEAAGPASPVEITVGPDGGSACLSVADEGPGMTEEFIRTRLFKPFSTTKKKGLGIGLYQCRQVVEAHGGTIEVRSREGGGTVFTVNLPLANGRVNVVNFSR